MTTRRKVAKGRKVPPILPREPLTKKAKAAIERYAVHKVTTRTGTVLLTRHLVKWVLEAERMRRADLYTWLEKRGYKWLSSQGFWSKDK